MKARIIREPRCALLWRIDESYPNYAAIARAWQPHRGDLLIPC